LSPVSRRPGSNKRSSSVAELQVTSPVGSPAKLASHRTAFELGEQYPPPPPSSSFPVLLAYYLPPPPSPNRGREGSVDLHIGPGQAFVSQFFVESIPPDPRGHSSTPPPPPPCAASAAFATAAASAVDAATKAVAKALRECHVVIQKGGPSSADDFRRWIETNCGPDLDFDEALLMAISNCKLLIAM